MCNTSFTAAPSFRAQFSSAGVSNHAALAELIRNSYAGRLVDILDVRTA